MPTTTSKTTQKSDLSIVHGATKDDAHLLMEIINSPLAPKINDAATLLWAYDKPPTWKQFDADHPKASPESGAVSAFMGMYETLGTFVKRGLLDRDLVYDLLWVAGAWERTKALALHYRQETGVAEIYENFEALARGQV